MSAPGYTLIYDHDCGFCRWSLELVLRRDRDGRIEPLALQDPRAGDLLADLDPDARMASWHLVSPSGERWSAGAAAPPLLRLLPGGALPARALAAAPRATERAYRFVADHRTAFGKVLSSGRRVA